MRGKKIWAVLGLMLLCGLPAWAQEGITGSVERADGRGVGGVTVVVSELGLVEISSSDGGFAFRGVPAGTYTLNFSLGENADSESNVEVTAGSATTVTKIVDWDVNFAETITVYSASRRRERVVDAPASVTLISAEELAEESSSGQLAKVLEFTPGVEVTQSGIYDFNLNSRGFNSSLNRRISVLVDGRDPAVPFLGSTEWAFLDNMEDMANVELVRGPSSALYGANAFNGVLNMVTKSARDAQGGRFQLSGGELSTLRATAGWAAGLGNEWYVKASGTYTEGEDFFQSRNVTTEYPGLPREAVPGPNEYDNYNVGLRFDKNFANNSILTFEGGLFEGNGGTSVTGIGRVNVPSSEREWFRINYGANHFNILAYHNGRQAEDQLALSSGGRIFLDTENQKIEVQGNGEFAGGKVRLVGGASHKEEEIDTANFAGIQTLVFSPVDSDSQAVFGQADFEINDKLKLVVAGRWDDSTLHDSQFSPKAALVWGLTPNHKLRFSYNEAFQVANYSEFFLDAPTAFPGPISAIDLSVIEGLLCAPFGVSCGFDSPVRVRALGNEDLELEEITAIEVGYSGIFGSKAFLTVDYYNNELENFITDLTANPFGAINPNFGPYTPPANHPAPGLLLSTLAASLPPSVFAFLSNNVDGTPIFALASYTNAGAVDTQGIDLGLNVYATPQWLVDFSYSWFDFDIQDTGGVAESNLLPNAPENKASIGVTYTGDKLRTSLKFRWVDDFLWSVGPFQGPIPSYEIVNLTGSYQVNDMIEVGVNISNLFDDEHYESIGGDLIGRRALAHVGFSW